MFRSLARWSLVPAVVAAFGCSSQGAEPDTLEGKFSSDRATLYDFAFHGKVYATDPGYAFSPESVIKDHLLYTIGHLNEQDSVGRLDALALKNIKVAGQGDGSLLVEYDATLPVAWGRKQTPPTEYEFVLPRKADFYGYQAFTDKYAKKCVDRGAHDVDAGSMWYYYRPKASSCVLEEADVVRFTATATESADNSNGSYPEYGMIWQDDLLDVVAIFGKYEDGTTTTSDVGIQAYNDFLDEIKSLFRSNALKIDPPIPPGAGVGAQDVTFTASLGGKKRVAIHTLLVDNVRKPWAGFAERYAALTPTADVILYNGHAGLGENVRALARMGSFTPNHHLLLFMNGCDTFAYVDGFLADARKNLNPDDADGTRFMDIMTNAMPAYFRSGSHTLMTLVGALANTKAPKAYQEIFRPIDSAQVVLVTGDKGNTFRPGMPIGSEP